MAEVDGDGLSLVQVMKATDEVWRAGRQRLPVFIHENTEQIVTEWESFARSLTPSSGDTTPLALRDHIHQILAFIIADIASAQTPKQQARKSRGKKEKVLDSTAAETHAALRLAGGFDIGQMVSEYRALRASIIGLWSKTATHMSAEDMVDLTRFNEAIDQELAESISYYSKKIVESKDIFIGIIGHDLRSPVQGIMLSAQLMLHMGTLNERQTMLTKKMLESSDRMNALINNLLDVTRARFGAGLHIHPVAMDIGAVAHQVVAEIRVVHPGRTIFLKVDGDTKGEWDKARIGQVFSNLVGNAVQYSFDDTTIKVVVNGDAKYVAISVHNIGTPIPPGSISKIFNPLTRAGMHKGNSASAVNLGLGLFITQEVVVAHGGTIHVTSSEEDGTMFTARFPRSKSAPSSVRRLRQAA